MTGYHPKALPLDADGFVQSFALENDVNALAFFDEFGFVVVEGVLSATEQTQTINDIWSKIEGFCGGRLNIRRDDPRSWHKHWPGGGPGLLGQALSGAAWLNRSNSNLRRVFEGIVGRTDLLCSVDNYGVLRPSRNVPSHPLPPQVPCRIDVARIQDAPIAGNPSQEMEPSGSEPTGIKHAADVPAWRTKSRWLHWDLSPFHWVEGTMRPFSFCPYSWISENNGTPLEPGARAKVQGLLNLIDARVEDGGFLRVPGFHKHLAAWAALPENQAYKEKMAEAYDFLEVPKGDPMLAWTQPVPMRAGSLLVWNSRATRFRVATQVPILLPDTPGGNRRYSGAHSGA